MKCNLEVLQLYKTNVTSLILKLTCDCYHNAYLMKSKTTMKPHEVGSEISCAWKTPTAVNTYQ